MATPTVWDTTTIRRELAHEGLHLAPETITAWTIPRRQEAILWLAEHDVREADFAKSKIPFPAWLDHEPPDTAPEEERGV